MNKILTILGCTLGYFSSLAGTFTSVQTGQYQNPTTWSSTGDTDGIPDADDNVTITTGHTVSVPNISNASRYCNDLTVSNGAFLTVSITLFVGGNYINNGVEQGNGAISFKNTGSISGSGTFGTSVKFTFLGIRTISAGTVITKGSSGTVRFLSSCTVINNGTFTIQSLVDGTNVTFTNGATGTLILRVAGFLDLSGDVFNASTSGNSVQIRYAGALPTSVGNTFHHLQISNTGVTQAASTTVNGNFTVDATRTYNLNGFNLTVGGNYSGTGTITYGASTLTFNGSSTQNVNCSGTSAIANMAVNGSDVNFVTGSYTISDGLTVNGSMDIAGAVSFTLLSDVTKTAYIAQSSGSVTGNMTIRRFIDDRPDGTSDLSSSITTADFTQWDDDFEMLFVPYVENVSQPSAFGYSESVWDFFAIDASSDPINPGEGYEVYLDNDGLTSTSWTGTVLDLIGTPNMGDIPVAVTVDNDGWNLIGNPYASFIDFTTFRNNAGTLMTNMFLYYDEAISDYNIGGAGDVIAASQGFWIQATFAGNVTFKENNKVVNTSSSFRNANAELFTLNVKTDATQYKSNTYFKFNQESSMEYEAGKDLTFLKVAAPKAPSLYSLSTEGKKLRINELNPEESLSIPVNFRAGVSAEYTIGISNIESAQLEGYTQIILEDKQSGIFHDLTLSDYSFDALSSENVDRFVLHLRKGSVSTTTSIETNAVTFKNTFEGAQVSFNYEATHTATISVYNTLGQLVVAPQDYEVNTNKIPVNIPENINGILLINITVGESTFVHKIYR